MAVLFASMDSENHKTVRIKETKEEEVFHLPPPRPTPRKKSAHPFLCRLKETAAFTVTAPNALIAAGFASMGMGLFTLFRPTPVILYLLISHFKKKHLLATGGNFIIYTGICWEGLLIFVLVFLGFILTFSVRIKKTGVLLLHPWGLLVLYFDAFVWLSLTLCLHLETLRAESVSNNNFTQIESPLACFIVIYIDIILFFLLHYVYATYFIAAELSVIEKCY